MTKRSAIAVHLLASFDRRLAFSTAPALAVAAYCVQGRQWARTHWSGPVPLSQRMSPRELSSSEIQRASLAKYRNRKSSNFGYGQRNVAESNSRDSGFGYP